MIQSKLESLFETTVNIASGFIISWLVWMYLVPVFWPMHTSSAAVGLGLTSLFTVTSFARSYIWRRFFNAGLHSAIKSAVNLYYTGVKL